MRGRGLAPSPTLVVASPSSLSRKGRGHIWNRRRNVSALRLGARQRVGPDIGAVVVEDERRILRYRHPHIVRHLVLELRRRPAGIAEGEQALARPFADADVAQDVDRGGERDAAVDVEGVGKEIGRASCRERVSLNV